MGYFLPSEVARLVLGYLKEVECKKSYQAFLNECKDLHEFAALLRQKREYPTTVADKTLTEILNQYGELKLGIKRHKDDSLEGLWLRLDTLLSQIRSRYQPSTVSMAIPIPAKAQANRMQRTYKPNAMGAVHQSLTATTPRPSSRSGLRQRRNSASREKNTDNFASPISTVGDELGTGHDEPTIGDFSGDQTMEMALSSNPTSPVKQPVEPLRTLSPRAMGAIQVDLLKGNSRYESVNLDEQLEGAQNDSRLSSAETALSQGANDEENTFSNHQRNSPKPKHKAGNKKGTNSKSSKKAAAKTRTLRSAKKQLVETMDTEEAKDGETSSKPVKENTPQVETPQVEIQEVESSQVETLQVEIPQVEENSSKQATVLETPKKTSDSTNPLPIGKSPRRKCPVPKRRSAGPDLPPVGPPLLMAQNSNSNSSNEEQIYSMPMLDDIINNVNIVDKLTEVINSSLGPDFITQNSKLQSAVDEPKDERPKTRKSSRRVKANKGTKSSKKTTSTSNDGMDVVTDNEIGSVLHVQVTNKFVGIGSRKEDISRQLFRIFDGQEPCWLKKDGEVMQHTVNNILQMTKSDPEFDILYHMFSDEKPLPADENDSMEIETSQSTNHPQEASEPHSEGPIASTSSASLGTTQVPSLAVGTPLDPPPPVGTPLGPPPPPVGSSPPVGTPLGPPPPPVGLPLGSTPPVGTPLGPPPLPKTDNIPIRKTAVQTAQVLYPGINGQPDIVQTVRITGLHEVNTTSQVPIDNPQDIAVAPSGENAGQFKVPDLPSGENPKEGSPAITETPVSDCNTKKSRKGGTRRRTIRKLLVPSNRRGTSTDSSDSGSCGSVHSPPSVQSPLSTQQMVVNASSSTMTVHPTPVPVQQPLTPTVRPSPIQQPLIPTVHPTSIQQPPTPTVHPTSIIPPLTPIVHSTPAQSHASPSMSDGSPQQHASQTPSSNQTTMPTMVSSTPDSFVTSTQIVSGGRDISSPMVSAGGIMDTGSDGTYSQQYSVVDLGHVQAPATISLVTSDGHNTTVASTFMPDFNILQQLSSTVYGTSQQQSSPQVSQSAAVPSSSAAQISAAGADPVKNGSSVAQETVILPGQDEIEAQQSSSDIAVAQSNNNVMKSTALLDMPDLAAVSQLLPADQSIESSTIQEESQTTFVQEEEQPCSSNYKPPAPAVQISSKPVTASSKEGKLNNTQTPSSVSRCLYQDDKTTSSTCLTSSSVEGGKLTGIAPLIGSPFYSNPETPGLGGNEEVGSESPVANSPYSAMTAAMQNQAVEQTPRTRRNYAAPSPLATSNATIDPGYCARTRVWPGLENRKKHYFWKTTTTTTVEQGNKSSAGKASEQKAFPQQQAGDSPAKENTTPPKSSYAGGEVAKTPLATREAEVAAAMVAMATTPVKESGCFAPLPNAEQLQDNPSTRVEQPVSEHQYGLQGCNSAQGPSPTVKAAESSTTTTQAVFQIPAKPRTPMKQRLLTRVKETTSPNRSSLLKKLIQVSNSEYQNGLTVTEAEGKVEKPAPPNTRSSPVKRVRTKDSREPRKSKRHKIGNTDIESFLSNLHKTP